MQAAESTSSRTLQGEKSIWLALELSRVEGWRCSNVSERVAVPQGKLMLNVLGILQRSGGRRCVEGWRCVWLLSHPVASSVTPKYLHPQHTSCIFWRNVGNLLCSPLSISARYGSLPSVTIPDTVHVQFFPPEGEHNDARNMSRNIV